MQRCVCVFVCLFFPPSPGWLFWRALTQRDRYWWVCPILGNTAFPETFSNDGWLSVLEGSTLWKNYMGLSEIAILCSSFIPLEPQRKYLPILVGLEVFDRPLICVQPKTPRVSLTFLIRSWSAGSVFWLSVVCLVTVVLSFTWRLICSWDDWQLSWDTAFLIMSPKSASILKDNVSMCHFRGFSLKSVCQSASYMCCHFMFTARLRLTSLLYILDSKTLLMARYIMN